VSLTPAQRRAKQTVRNLILSLIVTLGLTFAIVLGVPRDDSNMIQPVDYFAIATEASVSLGNQVLTPEIDPDWWANAARVQTDLDVKSWYVGFITDTNQYIGMAQSFDANPSWLALMLQGNWQDGEVEIGNQTWEVWPTLGPSKPPGTKEYALVHKDETSVVVIYGTASQEEFFELAQSINKQLD
jgi:hypothetical protein